MKSNKYIKNCIEEVYAKLTEYLPDIEIPEETFQKALDETFFYWGLYSEEETFRTSIEKLSRILVHRFLIVDIISYNNPTRNLFFFF